MVDSFVFTENSAHQKVVETFKDSFVQSVGWSIINGLLDFGNVTLFQESIVPNPFFTFHDALNESVRSGRVGDDVSSGGEVEVLTNVVNTFTLDQ